MLNLSAQAEPRRLAGRLLVVLILLLGAGLGITYFAYQNWLLGVIAAALVPGSAIAWVLEPIQIAKAHKREGSR